MRISDWSSDVCSSDLFHALRDRSRGVGDIDERAVDRQRLQVVEVAVEDAKIEIQAVIEPLALDAGLPRFDVLRLEHEVGAIERCGVERSEEHTSELQSLMRISYAVFCLNKKKKTQKQN